MPVTYREPPLLPNACKKMSLLSGLLEILSSVWKARLFRTNLILKNLSFCVRLF